MGGGGGKGVWEWWDVKRGMEYKGEGGVGEM